MISVEDRLPRTADPVIVLLDCHGKRTSWYFDIGYFKPRVDLDENTVGGTWHGRIPGESKRDPFESTPLEEYHGMQVTHWAPLPRPPEEYLQNHAKRLAKEHAEKEDISPKELFWRFYNNLIWNWAVNA